MPSIDAHEFLSEGEAFTVREAIELKGRKVVAKAGSFAKAGEQGTVQDPRRSPSGPLLVVAWDDGQTDVYTKGEARRYLRFQRSA